MLEKKYLSFLKLKNKIFLKNIFSLFSRKAILKNNYIYKKY